LVFHLLLSTVVEYYEINQLAVAQYVNWVSPQGGVKSNLKQRTWPKKFYVIYKACSLMALFFHLSSVCARSGYVCGYCSDLFTSGFGCCALSTYGGRRFLLLSLVSSSQSLFVWYFFRSHE